MKAVVAIMMALALLGCSKQVPHDADMDSDVSAPPKEVFTTPTDAMLGEWHGVEGLHLSVDKDVAKGAGHYVLMMRFGLDDTDSGIFTGLAVADTITFTRAGVAQALRHTDGKTTGLKWLDTKEDCLTVATGEGYCRD